MISTLRSQKVNEADGVSVECWVVLRDYGEGTRQRYVTHLWSRTGGYWWGNYFHDRMRANDDFVERVKKYAVGSCRLEAIRKGVI